MKRIFSLVLAVITATTLAFAGDFDCGSTVRLSATPNTGYHFDHWEKSANPGVSVSTSNPWDIEANSTNAGAYVAVFAINTYTVTYNKGTAVGATGDNQTDTKTHGVTLNLRSSALFTRTGYTQTAWSESPDGSTNDHAFGWGYTTNAAATFYPYWTADVYTISYAAGTGATGTVDPTNKTYGVNATLSSTTFDRTGYHQTGWATSNGGTKVYDLGATNYATEGDATLYPSWEINTYNITYKSGTHGSEADIVDSKEHFQSTYALRNSGDFTRTGYHQIGWSTTDDAAVAEYALEGVYAANAAITLYPVWAINQYTITFTNWNDTVLYQYTVNHGVTPTFSACGCGDPTRTEDVVNTYTFAGWNNTLVAATENATYKATFTPTAKTYTVTFTNWNDGVISSGNQTYNSTVTPPANPTRTEAGHTWTFQGWEDITNPGVVVSPIPNVTGDVTYRAYFTDELNPVTVNVATTGTGSGTVDIKQMDETSLGTSTTQPFGTSLKLYATPANACNTFVQWNDGNTDNPRTITVPASTTTYTATFNVIQYTITATPDDGSHGSVTVTAAP